MSQDLLIDLWRAGIALVVALLTAWAYRTARHISSSSQTTGDGTTSGASELSPAKKAAIWQWLRPRIRRLVSQSLRSELGQHSRRRGRR